MPRAGQFRRWLITWFPPAAADDAEEEGASDCEDSFVASSSEEEECARVAANRRRSLSRSPAPERMEVRRSRSPSAVAEEEHGDAGGDDVAAVPSVESLWELLSAAGAAFFVCQWERCPESGRLHLQGYVRFGVPVGVSKLQIALPGVHAEGARGTEEQCISYCSKEASRVAGPFRYGEPARPGRRVDLSSIKASVLEKGRIDREVIDQVSGQQALKFAEGLLKYSKVKRNWEMEVRWYHGSTGSGKTRAAFEEFPDAWMSSRNLKWWDGYDGQEVVIVDDFRRDFCTFHELLRIFDRYPYRVEFKGGSCQLLAKIIVVTCPWAPDVLYGGRSAEDVGQLMRRITEVRKFGEEVPFHEGEASAAGFVAHNSKDR